MADHVKRGQFSPGLQSNRWLWSASCLFVAWLTLGLGHTNASASQLTLQDLIVLKQVGYDDAQLEEAIKKAGKQGKFQLKPAQVLSLRKAGFSLKIIRLMGISRPVVAQTPVSLRELQGWLNQKKPEPWIKRQLQRRGISTPQFGSFVILQLSRLGASIELLRLIHQLKQARPGSRPPVVRPSVRRPTPPSNPLDDLPFMPGLSFDRPAPPRPQPPQNVILPTKKSRWGALKKKTKELSVREKELAQRKGLRVPRPLNGIYQHISRYYRIFVPKKWMILEDVHPDEGGLTLYLTPESEQRIRHLTKGLWITVEYLPRSNRTLLTRSLKQIARFVVQEFLATETGIKELVPLKKTRFHKRPGISVTIEGKERTHSTKLRSKVYFVRHKNAIFRMGFFAKPEQFAAFAKQAKPLLKKMRFLKPNKLRITQRLNQAASVQSIIQNNMKSVVSISVLRKHKGKSSFAASGTGFVITSNGYVLTNHHVAFNRQTGKPYPKYILNWDRNTGLKSVEARFVSAHFKYPQWQRSRMVDTKTGRISVRYQRQHIDIALLKIVKPGRYTAVKINPIETGMLGDTVIAMGFPLEGSGVQNLGNEDITATTGRISRLVRMGNRKVNEIQHTAKVAGGNSGGPLFDIHTGGAIGINTWVGIFDRRLPRPAMGLGYYYALPINLAWQFFPDYVDHPDGQLRHLQWYELGSQWLANGQHEPARRAFLRALQTHPSFTPAYAKLSILNLRRALKYNNDQRDKYMKIARRWADRGLQRDLGHPKLMELLAQISIFQKEWQTTRYLIGKMLKINPNRWSTYLLRAQMHRSQKRFDLALDDARSVIELAGQLLPTGYLTRGSILYAAKRFFEGQQAFRQALQIDPSNLDAKLGEVMGYVHLKQFDEAITRLKLIEQKYPHEPAVFRAKMFTYASAKKLKPGWTAFLNYWRRCMLRDIDPDAFSLYLGGLLAKRTLPPKAAFSIMWGMWGQLLQNHTKTSFAGRAGIILASQTKRMRYPGLSYGIIKLIHPMIKDPKLLSTINKLLPKLQPSGLSARGLFYLLFRPLPRWNPELIWKIFQLTPSIINKRTAQFLIKKHISPKLVLKMFLLSIKRRKMGIKSNTHTTHTTTAKGSRADILAINRVVQLAVQALYQGDLDLWMSAYLPNGNRVQYQRIFQNLYVALSNGRFVYHALPRARIDWKRHPRLGVIVRFYFRARFGRKPVKYYYWKLCKYAGRWVMY